MLCCCDRFSASPSFHCIPSHDRKRRINRQALTARDFGTGEGLENTGILCVFPIFQTERLGQKIRCSAADDLFGVSENTKKTPPRNLSSSRANKIRGATLIHGLRRALCGIPAYPRQLTYAHTSQNTRNTPLTAPSAVHLTSSFLPDSQQRGLSVKAFLPLSPLQRFLDCGFSLAHQIADVNGFLFGSFFHLALLIMP